MNDQPALHADPDDPVHDVEAVWHGPRGKTLPWSARYQTYALGLSVYVGILLTEFAIGLRLVGWPITEIGVTFFVCFGLMKIVDYERPLKAHVPTFLAEVRRATRRRRGPVKVTLALRVQKGHRRNWWADQIKRLTDYIDSRRQPPAEPPAPSTPPARRGPSFRRVRVLPPSTIERGKHRLNQAWRTTRMVLVFPFRLVHASPQGAGVLLVPVGFAIFVVGYWAIGQLGGLLSHVQ